MTLKVIEKYYSKEDNLFHIIKEKPNSFDKEDKKYITFDRFYKALNKDLKDADLLDYDFDGIDITKYNLNKAKISSAAMIKLGTYDNTLYQKISKDSQLVTITPSSSQNLLPQRQDDSDIEENHDFCNYTIYYISDLHLNHKLINKFRKLVNTYELEDYFSKIVRQIKDTIISPFCAVVFVGDISYNFEIFKIFFEVYRREIPYKQTFVILGNHELWDTTLNKRCKNLDEIIDKYRKFLNSLECKIHLLENELFIPSDEKQIYSEKEILTLDKKVLRNKFLQNGYAIFGGIGYAGLNDEFNANNEIYRTKFITREDEKNRSNKVDLLHKRLTEIAGDKKVFFITHMPKSDWSTCEYNKNWYYISGHTHKNFYIENDLMNVYADNQVGYYGENYKLKHITISKEYNIFQDYVDGIYEISRQQYLAFYYGIGNRIDFNREFEKLFMLKRNGVYCFLLKPIGNSNLKLLNGGSVKNIGEHDINYFYENLVNYSTSVKLFLKMYDDFEKRVACEVKKFGGYGNIHGCIIDIDFYNHLFVNPLDGTITPYFAYSMQDKFVYKNLISLLKAHNKELYERFTKLLENKNDKNLIILNDNLQITNKNTYIPDTNIYRISRIIKNFQYTTKNNIVRLWNDTIAANCTEENGKLIVRGIIYPEEMKQIAYEQKKIEKQQKTINKKSSRHQH